jgi:hypothetical protein
MSATHIGRLVLTKEMLVHTCGMDPIRQDHRRLPPSHLYGFREPRSGLDVLGSLGLGGSLGAVADSEFGQDRFDVVPNGFGTER